jgi:hypothetical protein
MQAWLDTNMPDIPYKIRGWLLYGLPASTPTIVKDFTLIP